MKRVVGIFTMVHSILSWLVMSSFLLLSCEGYDDHHSDGKTVPLVFSSPTILNLADTKASVDGSRFPTGTYPLGIWIVRGGTYQEQMEPFRNMKSELIVGAGNEIHWSYYVYDGNKQKDVISVMKNKAVDIYAYHPWSSTVTDIRAVHFTSGQTDWMWAEPVKFEAAKTDTDEQINCPLTFSHAMTCIEVNIRCQHQGSVRLTSMTLTDEAGRLVANGTMNATTGELKCETYVSSINIKPNAYITHEAKGTNIYIIMPSVGGDDDPLELNVEGKRMKLSFEFNGVTAKTEFILPDMMSGKKLDSFKTGYKYKYKLVLDNRMDFQPAGVEADWGEIYEDIVL